MPIFEFLGIIFEWHDNKFERVNSERGYTLEEIASIFEDDYSVTIDDTGGNYGEQRLLTTGMSNQFRLITVSWVERGNTVRIITAFSPSKAQQTMQKDSPTNPQETQEVLDIIAHYQTLDTSDFAVVEPLVIKKLRRRKAIVQAFVGSLSDEALDILSQHNSEQDRKRLDKVIQAMYAPL